VDSFTILSTARLQAGGAFFSYTQAFFRAQQNTKNEETERKGRSSFYSSP
jgi:hypothetical protein